MKRRLDYKWVTVALCILMVMISLGFVSSTKSLFPDEIAKALGTERSLVAVYESMRYIATAVVNLFFGFLIIKFKPKLLIIAGFLSLIGAVLIMGIASSLWALYIAGFLMGVGFSWTSTTMVGYVVGVWCKENKGTVMGVILASNGIGGAIAIQAVGSYIDPNVTGSYRDAYFMIAAVLAVAAAVLLIFFKNTPKEVASAPEIKEQKKKKKEESWVGIPFSKAYKRAFFWGALTCIFCSGLIIQGTSGIAAMHLKDVGIDYGAVKGMLSFGSLLLAVSKFLVGFIYDRFGIRIVSSFCTAMAIISSFLLALTGIGSGGIALAVIYTIVAQLAIPLETIMLPLYAADLFGEQSYANVLGIFVSVNTAGYAIGAPVMNICYDLTGSYTPALFAVGTVMAAIFILLQFVITAAHKERRCIESTSI